MTAPSRLEPARRRVRIARYVIGALAGAGFAGVAVAARDSHPATHHASATSGAAVASPSQDDQAQGSQSFGFGDSFVSPSQSAPSVQAGGS
jgi:hypothetical protein